MMILYRRHYILRWSLVFFARELFSDIQCFGSVSFWYVSGSSDPLSVITDPNEKYQWGKHLCPLNKSLIFLKRIFILVILVVICGRFTWFWLIFCYPDLFPEPAGRIETDPTLLIYWWDITRNNTISNGKSILNNEWSFYCRVGNLKLHWHLVL